MSSSPPSTRWDGLDVDRSGAREVGAEDASFLVEAAPELRVAELEQPEESAEALDCVTDRGCARDVGRCAPSSASRVAWARERSACTFLIQPATTAGSCRPRGARKSDRAPVALAQEVVRSRALGGRGRLDGGTASMRRSGAERVPQVRSGAAESRGRSGCMSPPLMSCCTPRSATAPSWTVPTGSLRRRDTLPPAVTSRDRRMRPTGTATISLQPAAIPSPTRHPRRPCVMVSGCRG